MCSSFGFSSLALFGLVLLSQVCYPIITLSHDGYPPNEVYILGFQGMVLGISFGVCSAAGFLPNLFGIVSVFTLIPFVILLK